MKIKLKANQQGQIYIPKILREQWGNEYILIPNAEGGCLYPTKAGPEGALRALKVVQEDLKNRAKLEKQKQEGQPERASSKEEKPHG